MPHAHTRIHEGVFEGKTAPQEETDEIVSPVDLEIIDLLDQRTVPVHPIPWNVRTDVGTWGELPRFGIASVEHFQEGTGLGIALAEEQKIIGQGPRHHGQIRLRVARCQTSRWAAPLAGANTLAYL